MKSQLFLLKSSVRLHSYFTVSSILFVIFTSFGIKFSLIEYGAVATFLSFFILGRCIMVDFYEIINPDIKDLPHSAQDNYTRDNIKKIVNKFFKNKKELSPEQKEEIEKTRLDIVNNIEPFINEENPDILFDMHNRKFQYILGNVIIGMCIGQRYNIPMELPLMLWIIYTFPF